MKSTQSVELPTTTYIALMAHLRRNGGQQDLSAAIATAVDSWHQFAHAFARTTRNAWEDLYVRRPGDKQFKLACVLRQEAASDAPACTPPAATPPLLAAAAGATVLSFPGESIPALAAALASALSQLTPPRNTDSGPRWDLPERRKFRYRLEDVAFE